ncbi:MAG TPA: hypothetical protein VF331_13005 [Polyangiales bacterium]
MPYLPRGGNVLVDSGGKIDASAAGMTPGAGGNSSAQTRAVGRILDAATDL